MERSIVVLGVGRVGSAIALDLASEPAFRVNAADADADALDALRLKASARGLEVGVRPVELGNPADLASVLDGHDLAVGAVPGPLGFMVLRGVLEAGCDVVDISFFGEDALALDELARERGRVAIVDAGVAPGFSNLVLGHYEARLTRCDRFECLVGGIPAEPEGPWGYRAPFSPIDVIAEYTRPARLRRGGETVTLPALSEVETVRIPGVGTLEAFNTDGLRTLLETSRVPDMVEKTMRWPGHAERVRALRDTGFFGTEPVNVGGRSVVPLELSAELLGRAWSYAPGEEDLTVMRMEVDGEDGEGPVRHTVELVDRYDAATGTSSMARATGYTATALARLVLDGVYREPGISPPEVVGARDGVLDRVLAHLADRGVRVEQRCQRPPVESRQGGNERVKPPGTA